MCFRKKNLDYEILKAVAERKPDVMREDVVYIFDLMERLLPKHKFSDAERTATLKNMWLRVEYLAADGLIKIGSQKIEGYATSHSMIQSITPEGRLLLEKLESRRIRNRFKNCLLIGFGAAGLKVIETVTPHLLRGLE
jgi:hypothetical protein